MKELNSTAPDTVSYDVLLRALQSQLLGGSAENDVEALLNLMHCLQIKKAALDKESAFQLTGASSNIDRTVQHGRPAPYAVPY